MLGATFRVSFLLLRSQRDGNEMTLEPIMLLSFIHLSPLVRSVTKNNFSTEFPSVLTSLTSLTTMSVCHHPACSAFNARIGLIIISENAEFLGSGFIRSSGPLWNSHSLGRLHFLNDFPSSIDW